MPVIPLLFLTSILVTLPPCPLMPAYLKYVDAWFSDVLLPRVVPLLYENGGPIIMLQVKLLISFASSFPFSLSPSPKTPSLCSVLSLPCQLISFFLSLPKLPLCVVSHLSLLVNLPPSSLPEPLLYVSPLVVHFLPFSQNSLFV